MFEGLEADQLEFKGTLEKRSESTFIASSFFGCVTLYKHLHVRYIHRPLGKSMSKNIRRKLKHGYTRKAKSHHNQMIQIIMMVVLSIKCRRETRDVKLVLLYLPLTSKCNRD